MTKGDETRDMILHQAALLFNRKGFFGAAMSDLMDETGLEKGGIYNHFKSKEDLALQAFDYAVGLLRQEFARVIHDHKNSVDRLVATMGIFQREAEGYPLPGGCPVMNTAIEADDTHPALRDRALAALEEWHQFVHRTLQRGKEKGDVRPDVDSDIFSSVFISLLEGAVMQSKLYGNQRHMHKAVAYLTDYIEREVRLH